MTEPQNTEGRTSLRVERLIPASIDDVFAAWIDPRIMARWLSPTGHAEVEADVRVGGRLNVVMVGEDIRIKHTGEYLIVEPPRRLSFTWISPYTGSDASIVTVSLRPQDLGTYLVLEHERLPQETVGSHEGGWGSIIERLAEVLAAGTPTSNLTTKPPEGGP